MLEIIGTAPSEQTYRNARAELLRIGETVSSWARQHGYQHQNVRSALLGRWRGPKASAIVKEISDYIAARKAAA